MLAAGLERPPQARQRAVTFSSHPDELVFDDDDYLAHETWIGPAFAALGDLRGARALDFGCGHGMAAVVLARLGAHVTAFDLAPAYLTEAQQRAVANGAAIDFVQADAEILPFRDRALDCVISIRFLFHADGATRVRILREMGRVSRRWLIVDYRHRYSLRYAAWRLKRMLGLTDVPLERVTRAEMRAELREAGLAVRKVIPVTRVFSDKWIVVGEAGHAS